MTIIIISKECFSLFFLHGFFLSAELDKPNEFESSLACDVYFVCASQKTCNPMPKKELVVCFRGCLHEKTRTGASFTLG